MVFAVETCRGASHYGVCSPAGCLYLNNNALHEELRDMATVANFATVQNEGGRQVTRFVEFYNLDMILSVGYRVKSSQGILFRQWANSVLKEYLLKGYAVNQRIDRLERRVSKTRGASQTSPSLRDTSPYLSGGLTGGSPAGF